MSSRANTMRAKLPSWLGGKRSSSWPAGMSWNELPMSARDESPEAVLASFALMAPETALEHLQTHRDGLTDFEADTRRAIKGPNILPTQKSPSWLLILLAGIPTPFNILLIFLAIISAAVPDRDWVSLSLLPPWHWDIKG